MGTVGASLPGGSSMASFSSVPASPLSSVPASSAIDDEGKDTRRPSLHAATNLLQECESPIRSLGEQDLTEAPKVMQNQIHSTHSRLGAWATPLIATDPLATSNHIDLCKNLISELDSDSQWPTLAAGNQNLTSRPQISPPLHSHQKSSEVHDKATEKPGLISSLAKPNLAANNLRFPWAARMNPSTRNLHRVTSPVYMEDGTPKVQIPDHVLLQGLENQREYVIGQFYRCSMPPGGLIHGVINRIWGRKCRIFCRKLGETSYIFHIPDASTRTWVLQRGLWHVDDCIMFVAPWNPTASLALPEISTMPVWVTLKNIPTQLYSILGIKWIASGLGEPMLTNKPRLDPTSLGEAKIMVEVELDKPFPQKIAAEDKEGTISMVDVEYTWLPSKCKRCGQLGHKESRCLEPVQTGPPIISATSKATALMDERLNASTLPVVSDPVVVAISDKASAPAVEAEVTTLDSAPITVTNVVNAKTNELGTPQVTEHSLTAATAPISNEAPDVELVNNVQTCPDSSETLPLPGTADPTSHEATDAATINKAVSENSTEPSDADHITVLSLEGISPFVDYANFEIVEHITTTSEGNKLSAICSESLPISQDEVVSPSLVIPTSASSPAVTNSPPLESYAVITTPPMVVTYEFAEPVNSVTGVQEDDLASLEPTEVIKETANSVTGVQEDTALLDPLENDVNRELFEDLDNVSTQRTLRERPVKPTHKAQEMQWTEVGGRKNRGRRGRGGRGHHS